eukprot:1267548-Rhodomonas_salina.1
MLGNCSLSPGNLRILRYLNKTKYYGLRIGTTDPLGHGPKLTVDVDASVADCGVTRRSTGGIATTSTDFAVQCSERDRARYT